MYSALACNAYRWGSVQINRRVRSPTFSKFVPGGKHKLALHCRSCTPGHHGWWGVDVGWSEGGTPLSLESDDLLCRLIVSELPMPLRGAAVGGERSNAAGCHALKLCGCQWPATEN